MEVLEAIKTRRSRRKFLKKRVPEEMFKKIIDAARCAPSSRNSQPWEFLIIREEETKKKLVEIKGKENEEAIVGADVIVVVCVNRNKSKTRWVEDGVCASMNILLTSHALGLGAVYITGYSNSSPEVTQKIKKLLKLPEEIIPVSIIPIGYPDPEEKLEEKELRKMDEIIHYERF